MAGERDTAPFVGQEDAGCGLGSHMHVSCRWDWIPMDDVWVAVLVLNP